MAKRTVNLPKLEVDPTLPSAPLCLAEGPRQRQYLKFIEPIINENIDLPFGEYMRLALHDAGTYKVVGKSGATDPSLRARPPEKRLQAFESSSASRRRSTPW